MPFLIAAEMTLCQSAHFSSLDLKGKKALIRCDFNLPLKEKRSLGSSSEPLAPD